MAPSLRPAALPAVTRPWARNGVLQRGEVLHRGARARRLVHGVHGPALARLHRRDGHQVRLDLVLGVGGRQLVLGGNGVGVRAVLGDGGEAVVQVLGGVAHVQGGRVHDPFGHKTRVGVRAGTHRVVAHVLHAAGDHDVVGAEADAARRRRHGGHGAGAHPVDREARHGPRQPGQQGGGAADGQALVAGLGRRGDGHLVDPLGGQGRVAAHQFADALDHEVIGARSGVNALLAGAAERGADAVDEDDRRGWSWLLPTLALRCCGFRCCFFRCSGVRSRGTPHRDMGAGSVHWAQTPRAARIRATSDNMLLVSNIAGKESGTVPSGA